jgi:hypothetical protein
MRSISNSLLANLAFWDFLIIFFCLPLVIFHELTKKWLLEDFSCKIVPYIEVPSRGVLKLLVLSASRIIAFKNLPDWTLCIFFEFPPPFLFLIIYAHICMHKNRQLC